MILCKQLNMASSTEVEYRPVNCMSVRIITQYISVLKMADCRK